MTLLLRKRDYMEYVINIGLGMTVYTLSRFASMSLSEESSISIALVAAVITVIWRISSHWNKMTTKIDLMTNTLNKMIQVLKTRPCIKTGQCDFLEELPTEKKGEEND